MMLLRHHRPDDLVAFGDGGPRTASELRRDAAKLAASLPEARPGSHVLLVFESDRYAFAVALLAAWARGHAVMLPPDDRPQTIGTLLQHADVATLVHDTRAGGYPTVDELLASEAGLPADAHAPSLGLATVFSAQLEHAHRKSSAQLLAEIDAVAELLEPSPGERILVDVPPNHLFGLVYGVLLPLQYGAAFSRAISPSAEAVIAGIEAHQTPVWVSVPHRLQLCAAAGERLRALRRVLCGVRPLPPATARALCSDHTTVIELLGSTETGGIAWRTAGADAPWQSLPGVETTVDDRGRLLVDSAFLSNDVPRPYPTAERARPHPNGGFEHLGHADELVEVDGRSVELPALREWLLSRPELLDAEVQHVWAPEGVTLLVAIVGSRCEPDTLRRALLERFDLGDLPCRMQQVEQLERDRLGGVERTLLLRTFGLAADGRPLATRIELVPSDADLDEERVTAVARVPSSYVHFEGHFDGYPILAAVVQLHELLLPLARRARPELGELTSLQQLKFLGRISPGDEITVVLRFPPDTDACDFEISKGDRRCSAGRLCFAGREVA